MSARRPYPYASATWKFLRDAPKERQLPFWRSETLTELNQLDCPFLRLPAELRIKIYEYASHGQVIRFDAVNTKRLRYGRHLSRKSPNLQLSLIHICAQIRHEAHATLFSFAIISLAFLGHINVVACALGRETLRLIKCISVDMCDILELSRSMIRFPTGPSSYPALASKLPAVERIQLTRSYSKFSSERTATTLRQIWRKADLKVSFADRKR